MPPNPRTAWKYLKPFFDELPEQFDWLASPKSGKHAKEITLANQDIKAAKEAGIPIDPSGSHVNLNPPRFHSTVEQALGNKKMPQSMAPEKLLENLTKHGARKSELDYIDLNAIPVNEKGKITLDAISEAHDQSLLGVMADRRSGIRGVSSAGQGTHRQRLRGNRTSTNSQQREGRFN